MQGEWVQLIPGWGTKIPPAGKDDQRILKKEKEKKHQPRMTSKEV